MSYLNQVDPSQAASSSATPDEFEARRKTSALKSDPAIAAIATNTFEADAIESSSPLALAPALSTPKKSSVRPLTESTAVSGASPVRGVLGRSLSNGRLEMASPAKANPDFSKDRKSKRFSRSGAPPVASSNNGAPSHVATSSTRVLPRLDFDHLNAGPGQLQTVVESPTRRGRSSSGMTTSERRIAAQTDTTHMATKSKETRGTNLKSTTSKENLPLKSPRLVSPRASLSKMQKSNSGPVENIFDLRSSLGLIAPLLFRARGAEYRHSFDLIRAKENEAKEVELEISIHEQLLVYINQFEATATLKDVLRKLSKFYEKSMEQVTSKKFAEMSVESIKTTINSLRDSIPLDSAKEPVFAVHKHAEYLSCKKLRSKVKEYIQLCQTIMKNISAAKDLSTSKANLTQEILTKTNTLAELRVLIAEEKTKIIQHYESSDAGYQAGLHLFAGTFPQFPVKKEEKKDKVLSSHNEVVFIEMAKIALRQNGSTPIGGSSGGVYLINYQDKPLFVFKSLEEAPGQPGNKNTQKDTDLRVVGGRSLDPYRIGFPPSECILREFAVAQFMKDPRKTIATLNINGSLMSGALMAYQPHVYSIDAVRRVLETEEKQAEIKGYDAQIQIIRGDLTIPNADLVLQSQALLKSKGWMEKNLEGCFAPAPETEAQKRLVDASRPASGVLVKPSSLKIWDQIDQASIDSLVYNTFAIPDFDRNAGNILVVEHKTTKDKPFGLFFIDADQAFPDTWQTMNLPAWSDASRFDFILKDNSDLAEKIMNLSAEKIISTLDRTGIRFQSEVEEVIDPSDGSGCIVGGDLMNIVKCFHLVAKIGLVNGNTANTTAQALCSIITNKSFSRIQGLIAKQEPVSSKKTLVSSSEGLSISTPSGNPEIATILGNRNYNKEPKLWKAVAEAILKSLNAAGSSPSKTKTEEK